MGCHSVIRDLVRGQRAMGGIDFSTLAMKVGEASIGYGAFIQALIDFLISFKGNVGKDD